jgi:hypothetical protein
MTMMNKYGILFVKSWLKFKDILVSGPDYIGFAEHVKALRESGMPYNDEDLLRIARQYNCHKIYIKDSKISWPDETY